MATHKYNPVIIPYCKPTRSQVLILQSCSFLSLQSDVVPSSSSSSSSEDTSEQATRIIMVSLPDSSDDYQTRPEKHHSISQNSPVTNIALDDLAEIVFNEMHKREQEGNKSDRGKRKLLVSLDTKVTENIRGGECCSKHHVFKDTINRVFKMLVAERKGNGKGVDFLETAKKKGMTFPRPRWRSAQTWKGL